MKSVFNQNFIKEEKSVLNCITNFQKMGTSIYEGTRNSIKIFDIGDFTISIKAFKKPSLINKIVYTYFRKSKAKRSFEFANLLIEKGIGTPTPIAYYEEKDLIGLKRSFYVCKYIEYDLRFRELLSVEDEVEKEYILRKFTQFTFKIHENDINFKDHSSGNTLIKKNDKNYDFYLVDLNRTTFNKIMSFEDRMKNFSRLTSKKEVIEIMSNEYANLYKRSNEEVFKLMWHYTQEFQDKFKRKRKLKHQLKFWKK